MPPLRHDAAPVALALGAFGAAACALLAAAPFDPGTAPVAPPETRVEPVTDVFHGQEVVDDYRWLEALESESPDVEAWTTAQIEYMRSRIDALPCRSAVEQALRPLMEIGSVSAPTMCGNLY